MGHQNRGNRDPLGFGTSPKENVERVPISPISSKMMRGSLFLLFPLFWWSIFYHIVKTWATKIGEIGDPVMVLALYPGKTLRRSLFPLFL